MTDDDFELLNSLVPLDEREHFQRFTVAVNNTTRVIDALSLWGTLPVASEGVDDPDQQMRAPDIRWLTSETRLTEDVILSALGALVACKMVTVVRDGVWTIAAPRGEKENQVARDRLWTHLRSATRDGKPRPAGAPWLPEPPAGPPGS
ncbi:hypothetical protein ACIQB5_47825 [Streptomyces sp. NPDC088560]|uniref:hypothetical protein n=1 Tax=Streptomyces sp. NPDC088560 TaxID=3365868 RepID=UPI00382998F8